MASERLFGRVAEIEEALDPQLRDWREAGPFDPAFVETLTVWSKAVWAAAEMLGAAALSPAEVERGLALAQRPVFVCGVHRSGTTLLRDLLDGHPELVALPFESEFYTRLEPVLGHLARAERTAFLGQRWLQRLANPANQPPYWLLGRSDALASPYVEFARRFRAWSGELAPLAACAVAYGGEQGQARMWVEKTPTSERLLDRIWREFPHARVLHLVRRPEAVMSSYKALLARAGLRPGNMVPMLHRLARSYRIALRLHETRPDSYRLVRYEDLAHDPAAAMDEVARFLGIAPLPELAQPTVAGRAAVSNSSFGAGRGGASDGLTRLELGVLSWAVGGSGARLGYQRNRSAA